MARTKPPAVLAISAKAFDKLSLAEQLEALRPISNHRLQCYGCALPEPYEVMEMLGIERKGEEDAICQAYYVLGFLSGQAMPTFAARGGER